MAQPLIPREMAQPFHIDGTGAVASVSNPDDALLGHVASIVMTSPGERVMMPGYGAGARRYMFENMEPAIQASMAAALGDALQRFEPGIIVKGIQAIPHDPREGTIEILVSYQTHTSDQTFQVAVSSSGQVSGMTNG